MNAELARAVLIELAERGVREICVCAGARNAPLVLQLEQTSGFQLFNFFEERSAGFFALGRSRATGRPTAVMTTSGTAVAELLPAVIEGHYQNLPLVVVSADRPRSYRGTGAPQSIEQVRIFGDYAEVCVDAENPSELAELRRASGMRPVHLNVCFSEPKADQSVAPLSLTPAEVRGGLPPEASPQPEIESLERPLVIVGGLPTEASQRVATFLNQTRVPFVAEATAGLSLSTEALTRRLRVPEKSLPVAIERGEVRSVLRIGGVPTLRFWRDLEEKYRDLPVVSVETAFSGLARASRVLIGAGALERVRLSENSASSARARDEKAFAAVTSLCEQFPRAENSLVRGFARAAHGDAVYLGNSLPIREWDLVSGDLPAPRVWANRGANGIDGQISSFLGWTKDPGPKAWALLGDLTTLYDLSAPWVTPQLSPRPRRIVVLNNQGGQIFKPLFGRELFLNSHQIGFSHWARMWNWDYREAFDSSVWSTEDEAPARVIELKPDAAATEKWLRAWRDV